MNQKRSAQSIAQSAFVEFNNLPYFRNIPKDGRIIFLNPLFDDTNNDWILLYPVRPDKLQRIIGIEPKVSCYLGFRSADPKRDFELPLGTFVVQHLSFPGVTNALSTLENDFHNCSAILEKYLLISCRDKSQRDGISLLLRTELEYLISAIRSIYDLLQKLSKHASALVREVEKPHKHMIEELPNSFDDIVSYGDQLRSAQQIREKYRLPEPLANFYASEAPHFKWLRGLRVAIEHHGYTIDSIFDLDEGAAISIKDDSWSALTIWQEPGYIKNEHLGSLHAVFVFLVAQAIEMTTRYVNAFAESVSVIPQAIEPGMKLYVRNYFSHHLVALKEAMESPWERSES